MVKVVRQSHVAFTTVLLLCLFAIPLHAIEVDFGCTDENCIVKTSNNKDRFLIIRGDSILDNQDDLVKGVELCVVDGGKYRKTKG